MKLELVRFVWFLGYPRIPKLNQLLFKFVKLTRESSFIILECFILSTGQHIGTLQLYNNLYNLIYDLCLKFQDKMNLDEFFKRIGFSRPFEKPDLVTLNAIHKHFVMTVPFENLSIHCGEKIGMDREAIFNKIVRNQRGGWCMEGNYLLSWVLRELGYDLVMLGARVIFGNVNYACAPESHLINMVTIDGKAYIADVSFGLSLQLREPIELVSGKDHTEAAGVFRLIDQEGVWFL